MSTSLIRSLLQYQLFLFSLQQANKGINYIDLLFGNDSNVQYLNIFMKFLRTLDPLKGLKGKLNFLKQENQPVLQIVKLANSLNHNQKIQEQSQSSLDKLSIDDINALSSPQQSRINQREYRKTLFEANAHKNANPNLPIGTIHEELDIHQKRLLTSLLKFSDKLTARQMMYLQYAVRSKINSIYPNWKNLHFNPESPFRREFVVMPNLSSLEHLNQLKFAPKKKVTAAIIGSRKKAEPTPKA